MIQLLCYSALLNVNIIMSLLSDASAGVGERDFLRFMYLVEALRVIFVEVE